MPLLKLETTVPLSEEHAAALLRDLSRTVAQVLSKPEDYVMVSLQPAKMIMAGKEGDSVFVDLRSIGGLSGQVNRQLAQAQCKVAGQFLSVPPERVYITFTDVDAGNWGWNGRTFG